MTLAAKIIEPPSQWPVAVVMMAATTPASTHVSAHGESYSRGQAGADRLGVLTPLSAPSHASCWSSRFMLRRVWLAVRGTSASASPVPSPLGAARSPGGVSSAPFTGFIGQAARPGRRRWTTAWRVSWGQRRRGWARPTQPSPRRPWRNRPGSCPAPTGRRRRRRGSHRP